MFNIFNNSMLFGRSGRRAAAREAQLASLDHDQVCAAIARCHQENEQLQEILNPQTRSPRNLEGDFDEGGAFQAAIGPLSEYQRLVLRLSGMIARTRVSTALAAGLSYADMELFQWAVTILGATSTFMIALKSTISTEPDHGFWIGIFAIAISAVATIVSTMNAFYTPREDYNRSWQMLSRLKRLHADLVFDVIGSTAALRDESPIQSDNLTDIRVKRLSAWNTIFEQIQDEVAVGLSSQEAPGSRRRGG